MLFKSTETASCMEKCTGSHNRYHKSSLAQEWNPLRCISHKSDGSWGLILDLQQFNSYWSQLSPMLHYLHVQLQDNICLHELCGDETVIYKNRDCEWLTDSWILRNERRGLHPFHWLNTWSDCTPTADGIWEAVKGIHGSVPGRTHQLYIWAACIFQCGSQTQLDLILQHSLYCLSLSS